MDKFALVTGGNRGIGLEVCRQLAEQGKPVLLACRDVEKGSVLAQDLAKATSAVVRCVHLDTSSTHSIQELANLVKQEYDQQIDLLVNNAAILVPSAWDKDAYDRTLAVNTAGPVSISQALLPLLAPGALIVMVSSGVGKLANLTSDYQEAVQAITDLASLPTAVPFNADSPMGKSAPEMGGYAPTYSVAKALLNRAVQLMAEDEGFRQRGVRVAATCPGWCRTDMGSAAATRSAGQGAESVLWPWANWSSSLNGSFSKDGNIMDWVTPCSWA